MSNLAAIMAVGLLLGILFGAWVMPTLISSYVGGLFDPQRRSPAVIEHQERVERNWREETDPQKMIDAFTDELRADWGMKPLPPPTPGPPGYGYTEVWK